MSEPNVNAPIDDELPTPPSQAAPEQAPPVDGNIDASLLGEVPKLGEALPVGTYHFRAERYMEMWQEPDKNSPEELLFGSQPQFMIFWTCQEEPHTGATFPDFIQWVNQETMQAAKGGNRTALTLLRSRLQRAKSILTAAEYPVGSSLDFKAFLASHPEIKIQLGVRERKMKDATGVPKGTGEMVNNAIRYTGLRMPR